MEGHTKSIRSVARNIIFLGIYISCTIVHVLVSPLKNYFIEGVKIARRAIWKTKLKSFGDFSDIYSQVVIHDSKNVSIGSEVAIAEYVHIWGTGGVEIGDNVLIGSHAVITSLTHNPDCKARRKALIRKPVKIKNCAWIGSGAIILPGVTIGEGSVVGAGSVVTTDIPAHTIVMGIPAQFLRDVRYEQ